MVNIIFQNINIRIQLYMIDYYDKLLIFIDQLPYYSHKSLCVRDGRAMLFFDPRPTKNEI